MAQFSMEIMRLTGSVLRGNQHHPLSEWVLDTKEARHTLRGGDYICTGLAGEQWNVAQEIFEATYEEMMSAEPSHIAQAEAFMKGALGKGYRQNVEGLAALLANTAETALTEAKAEIDRLKTEANDHENWASSMREGLDHGRDLLARAKVALTEAKRREEKLVEALAQAALELEEAADIFAPEMPSLSEIYRLAAARARHPAPEPSKVGQAPMAGSGYDAALAASPAPATPASTLATLGEAKVAFGLEAQGHIPTIEAMLKHGEDWEAIGQLIGWDGQTAKQYYERHVSRASPAPATPTEESKP